MARHPSILPAREAEGLDHTATVQDTRIGQEGLGVAVHRVRELGRHIGSGEVACGRSVVAQVETDANNRRRLLQWEDDRTGRTHMTHTVELPAEVQAPGLCTGPVVGHRDLPWRQDLASAPETTGSPRLFRGRLHRGRSSKRTNRLHRGYVRLSGHAG